MEPQSAPAEAGAPPDAAQPALSAESAGPVEPATAAEPQEEKDVGSIRLTDFERRDPPRTEGDRRPGYQAVIRQSVLNQIHRHGLASSDVEVCGVLVGNVHYDSNGPWLYIEYAIEGNNAAGKSTQVTFTADTWTHIQGTMDRDYADKRIVGWYHTHPSFGIFLSDMDLFIQDNFFPLPWQVAFVYDPKAQEEGLFIWRKNKTIPEKFLVEPDTGRGEFTRTVEQAKPVRDYAAGAGAELAARLDTIEKRQKVILFVLALVGLIALAWPLVVSAFLPDLFKPKSPLPTIKLEQRDPTP